MTVGSLSWMNALTLSFGMNKRSWSQDEPRPVEVVAAGEILDLQPDIAEELLALA